MHPRCIRGRLGDNRTRPACAQRLLSFDSGRSNSTPATAGFVAALTSSRCRLGTSTSCCFSPADLQILRTNGDGANIQQLDTGGFQARVSVGGTQSGAFFGGSGAAWHLFEIRTNPNGVAVLLDGVTVLTDPAITTFRSVTMNVWDSPAGASAYFDDFVAIF